MSLQADHAQLALDPAESTARPAVKPAARPSESHTMLHAAQSLLYIIIVAIFIITFAVQPFRIPSESMEPTLMVGDFLLVAKQDFPVPTDALPLPSTPIRRGDVVVFHYPIDPSIHLVKRVIGMPGDHLRLRDGRVFINGRALNEPYAVYRPGPSDNFRDNFPRLSNPDPDVTSNWWIQMKSLVNHGELTVRRQTAADLLLPERREQGRRSAHRPCIGDAAAPAAYQLHPRRDRQLRPLGPDPARGPLTRSRANTCFSATLIMYQWRDDVDEHRRADDQGSRAKSSRGD